MIVKIESIYVAGVQLSCPVEINLDECEVYLEVWNQVRDSNSQRIRLDLREEIESQLAQFPNTKKVDA